jgi:triosephosphate isomerase (TIM)
MRRHLQCGFAVKSGNLIFMAQQLPPLVAGNWKMNGLRCSLSEVVSMREATAAGIAGQAEVVVCPPATLLMAVAAICAGSPLKAGGQDCHPEPGGAFTGDVSAGMLKDVGASFVILGHSERRNLHHESNATVRLKAQAALRAGLTPIICVGETPEEREKGHALATVSAQLAGSFAKESPPGGMVVAYEPVWAIGTGVTPAKREIAQMHRFIREEIAKHWSEKAHALRILYGGSVKPENAAELLSAGDVDGALVGGASLTSAAFMEIAGFYRWRAARQV